MLKVVGAILSVVTSYSAMSAEKVPIDACNTVMGNVTENCALMSLNPGKKVKSKTAYKKGISKQGKAQQKELDILLLVETINSLAMPDREAYLAQDSTVICQNENVKKVLRKYGASIDDALAAEYERRMVALSESADADSLLITCLGALSTGIVRLQSMACEGIVQIMASKGDASLLGSAIRRFEMVASPEEAAEMRKMYDDILNPVSFADQVAGTWVSPDYKSDVRNFPYYMLHIYSLDNDDGIRLLNIPGETTYLESPEIFSLCRSQSIGGSDGHIVASFGSELLKRGNSEFAKLGFEMTRDIRATSRAAISSSKASEILTVYALLMMNSILLMLQIARC